MSTISKTTTVIKASRTYSSPTTISSTGEVEQIKSSGTAKTGTLTTRTDNTSGTLTMSSGHGIQTGDKIDIYWSGGKRYNVTVGTVSTNSVPISSGSGDNLPTANTTLTAMVASDLTFVLDADEAEALLCASTAGIRATISFFASSTLELAVNLDSTNNYVYFWDEPSGITNPMAGDSITTVRITHESSTTAAVVEAYALYNN